MTLNDVANFIEITYRQKTFKTIETEETEWVCCGRCYKLFKWQSCLISLFVHVYISAVVWMRIEHDEDIDYLEALPKNYWKNMVKIVFGILFTSPGRL